MRVLPFPAATQCRRDAAERALAAAERALAQLELAAPKAAQVAKAKREEAADLQARLAELKVGVSAVVCMSVKVWGVESTAFSLLTLAVQQ
jgi:hypothetical protein